MARAVLFSREDVSNFIMQNFEPAWEMVRPVPIVRIDFSNGTVATRTLHGNVASYVCALDGQVLDILPGLYTPDVFTTALEQPKNLAAAMSRLEPAQRLEHLRGYHRDRAAALRTAQLAEALRAAQNANRPPVSTPRIVDLGKRTLERRTEQLVLTQVAANQNTAGPLPRTAAELAGWQPLVADTRRNETERRLMIHERFTSADAVRPEQIKRWLYRDVLHADIDDPTMGLGRDMFDDLER
jgi:hypothetical protein